MSVAMLRHCVVSVPLTRCRAGGGRSFVTLARSANYRPLIQRLCLPAAGRTALSTLSQSLPWRSPSHRRLFEKCCIPALSRVVLPQPASWHLTSKRNKNTYYGFASRKPKPMSAFGTFYHIFLGTIMVSIVLTPLYVLVVHSLNTISYRYA